MTTTDKNDLQQSKSPNTVCMHYVHAACQNAEAAGLNVEDCLEQAGLQLNLLKKPQARISALRYEKLTRYIAEQLDDELLMQGGIARSRVGCFNLMCHLAIHEQTLRQGILRSLQFYKLLWGDIYYQLSSDEDLAYLSIHFDNPSTDPLHITKDCGLVLLHRFFSWLINQHIPLHHVTYTFTKPDHHEEHNRLYRCPIHYSGDIDAIAFSNALLNKPVVQTKETLSHFLKGAPSNLMVIPSNGNSLTSQIRVVLAESLYTTPPSLEQIANALNTTTQTVRRKLKKENTSYQEIKDQLRQDSAINFLCNSNLPINDIALRLGFSEPSTFHRAFKKWTGTTPGNYRR
ncbi:hypothetical protein A9Q99_02950 [Gammaproteobacteria bacterium 45_16_T64]|nr:hypothetical protein A9Q99_02950 [Gammaproteobacteria bacterium 45_16_T64]